MRVVKIKMFNLHLQKKKDIETKNKRKRSKVMAKELKRLMLAGGGLFTLEGAIVTVHPVDIPVSFEARSDNYEEMVTEIIKLCPRGANAYCLRCPEPLRRGVHVAVQYYIV